MGNNELATKLDLLHALKAQKEELEAQIEALTDEVKAEMDTRGVKKLEIGERTATFSRCWSTRFDSTAFKKDHAEMYDSYTREIPMTKFTVK